MCPLLLPIPSSIFSACNGLHLILHQKEEDHTLGMVEQKGQRSLGP